MTCLVSVQFAAQIINVPTSASLHGRQVVGRVCATQGHAGRKRGVSGCIPGSGTRSKTNCIGSFRFYSILQIANVQSSTFCTYFKSWHCVAVVTHGRPEGKLRDLLTNALKASCLTLWIRTNTSSMHLQRHGVKNVPVQCMQLEDTRHRQVTDWVSEQLATRRLRCACAAFPNLFHLL